MKVLVYTASSICNPQFGIQMERAIEFYKQGNEVIFCYCVGVMKACSANPFGNSAFCSICKYGFSKGKQLLPKGIRVIGLRKVEKRDFSYHNFQTIKDIKTYKYKGVDVGFSVISVYVTKTRNPNPVFDQSFIKCINQLICEAEALVDATESLIIEETPELIVFFNGRFFDTKPFYSLAKLHHINYLTTENVGGVRAGNEYKMVKFYNSIPHDASLMYHNCLASWDNSQETEEEKVKRGKSFYEKRRKGEKAGDYVYTSGQREGQLPTTYNPNKKNIVVFCSSEDEYSSVSSDIDKLQLFPSQYEAIKYLVDSIKDENYHFFVRIHPNMKGLNFEYHRNLYKLASYKNVTVISPEDETSSYSLMDIAYNIVVFGSTIGAESMYWGKSVVLLGYAAYYYWGCFSLPHDKKQAVEMVMNPSIYPGAREMAIKYGYYFLNNSLAETSKYISITPTQKSLFGNNIYVYDYLKVLGSSTLYRYIYLVYTKLVSFLHRNRIKYPDRLIK